MVLPPQLLGRVAAVAEDTMGFCFLRRLAERFRLGSLLDRGSLRVRFSADFLLRRGNVAYFSKAVALLSTEVVDEFINVFFFSGRHF